jgi:S1-C subfamily serine protease
VTLRDSFLYRQNGLACVEVYETQPGGPAAVAGMQAGDLVLGVGKAPIVAVADFTDLVRGYPSGAVVTVVVQRSGKQLALVLTLGLSPYADPKATAEPSATPTATPRPK